MEFISEYKYAEVKVFTIQELKDKLKNTQEKRKQLEECIKEYDMWIKAYEYELKYRKPKCIGCQEGYLNQIGHYGGCISDPMDIELQSIIDSQN